LLVVMTSEVSGKSQTKGNDLDWDTEWANAAELLETDKSVKVSIKMANKGGLVAHIGRLKAFIPASQINQTRFQDGDEDNVQMITKLAPLVGEKMEVKVMSVDKDSRQLLLSERIFIADMARSKIKKGTVYNGIVQRIANYGAFVELLDDKGISIGVEGLLHVSEISWDRVKHPQEVLVEGNGVKVMVTSVDEDKKRLSLSMRQMTADPLLQTLDTLIPVEGAGQAIEESEIEPFPELEKILSTLLAEPGVEAVTPGRQAIEEKVVSQDLEVWLTNVAIEDGYNLLVRAGRQVQEIRVVTALGREEIKGIVRRVTNSIQ